MRKIFVLLAFMSVVLNAEIKLTEELIDNDIETNEYQLFVTKTVNVSTDNLKSKVVFTGEIEDYLEKFREKYEQHIQEELALIAGETVKFIARSIFGKLAGGDNSNIFFGDANYVQVTDYTKDAKLVTRVIKYIVSDENLPLEDQNMIYATTNSDSYHFNEGKVKVLFTTDKQLDKYNKGLK
jgi:hypothetical protein